MDINYRSGMSVSQSGGRRFMKRAVNVNIGVVTLILTRLDGMELKGCYHSPQIQKKIGLGCHEYAG